VITWSEVAIMLIGLGAVVLLVALFG